MAPKAYYGPPLIPKRASNNALTQSQLYSMDILSIILEGGGILTAVEKVATHGVGHWNNSVGVTDQRVASFSLNIELFSTCSISIEPYFM